MFFFFFFFYATATTEIYTLSLHDALPIYFDPPYGVRYGSNFQPFVNKKDVKDRDDDLTHEPETIRAFRDTWELGDRKSTRLNSSHSQISYAVFCLKKKKKKNTKHKNKQKK